MAGVTDDRGLLLAERLAAARQSLRGNLDRLQQAQAELRLVRGQLWVGRGERQAAHDAAYARLEARLATMPVVEQAKGVLMARLRCDPEQAFAMLRRASQRSNVQVRVLAADIVARAAGHARDGRARDRRTRDGRGRDGRAAARPARPAP